MEAVAATLIHTYNGDAFQRVIYTESHDEVASKARVPEEIMPGEAHHFYPKKRATLGTALMLTAPGIPMLFQGQAMLTGGFFSDDQPLDWKRAEEYSGLVHLHRDLIALRRNLHGTTRGLTGQHTEVFHINNEAKVIAFRRWDAGGPGDETIILANFADTTHEAYCIGLPAAGQWQVRFNSDWKGYDQDFGNFESLGAEAAEDEYDGLPYSACFGLAPYSLLIISQ
jgi:1,4-alpha-glucan branching enzyme